MLVYQHYTKGREIPSLKLQHFVFNHRDNLVLKLGYVISLG